LNFGQPLKPRGSISFIVPMVGTGLNSMMFGYFSIHCERDIGFHVLWKQVHILSSLFSQFFCWWVDIVLLIDSICTLVDVIIVNFTWANLVSWTTFSREVVASLVAQVKKRFYCNHYSIDVFFPLAIEVFYVFINKLTTLFIDVLTWCGQ